MSEKMRSDFEAAIKLNDPEIDFARSENFPELYNSLMLQSEWRGFQLGYKAGCEDMQETAAQACEGLAVTPTALSRVDRDGAPYISPPDVYDCADAIRKLTIEGQP